MKMRSLTNTAGFLLLAIVIVGTLREAFPRERGPRIEVVCPWSPIPVRIAEHPVLVYELHITNFDKVALTLSALEVFGDTDGAEALESVSGDALTPMMMAVGTNEPVRDARKIEPGRRAVLFLWITLKADSPLPHGLRHRMVFMPDGTKEGDASAPPATLENFPVQVSDGVVPVIASPFRDGVWVAGDGPGNDSAHRRSLLAIDGHVHAPERFASDWVKVGPNGDSHEGTARNENYWAYGEPVLAVADGEVTQLADGIGDNTPHQLPQPVTLDNILGNYITLRIAPDRYVTYAHLQKGSITVAMHERVRRGTVIGRIGNSGQATAPHLHLQLTDGSPALQAEGVPFIFDHFTDFGPGETYEANKHPSIARKRALPGKDEVIGLTAAPQNREHSEMIKIP
jgi:murein DD-endopeptidase